MRILHVLGSLDRGGVETWLVQVLRHIDRSRYQFDFLVHTEKPCAYDDEVRALGAKIIPCLAPSNPAKYANNFRRILRDHGPYDCVHSHVHHYSGYVLALARLGGVPARVAHSHSDTRKAEKRRNTRRRLYLYAMTKLLYANATAGLAVGDGAARSLFGERWENDPRWQLSHLGIDFEPFSRPANRSKTRAELGIAENSFVVGHVGRFLPVKNHAFIVEVAAAVCAIRPDTVFLLVGDGPLRRQIEKEVRFRGIEQNFRFTGVRADVPALMRSAMDVFLFPSIFEGLGLVVLEAQLAGVSCVVSDVVPTEADVVPGAVKRLPLDFPAALWANALFSSSSFPVGREELLHGLQYHSITESAKRLSSVYERCRISSSSASFADGLVTGAK